MPKFIEKPPSGGFFVPARAKICRDNKKKGPSKHYHLSALKTSENGREVSIYGAFSSSGDGWRVAVQVAGIRGFPVGGGG